MTVSLLNTTNPPSAVGVDSFVQPPFIHAYRAPTTLDIYNPGTRWLDDEGSVRTIYETTGAGVWIVGDNSPATTTAFGTVKLATLSQLQNGNAPSGAIVPLSNDVATVIQGIVVGAVPPATETQQGIAEIATQVETDAGTDDTRIVTPLKLANFISGGGGAGDFSTLHASGAVTFDSTLLVSGLATLAASAVIDTAGTALNLATDSDTAAVNLGTVGDRTITVGNVTGATAVNINTGTGSFTVSTTGAGDIVLNSDDTMLLDADGVLELNSSAGVISIGNDADAQNINLGTGASQRVITIGNGTSATQVVINAGTAGVLLGTNTIAHPVVIGNQTGNSSLVLDSGTGAIQLGTTIAKIITIGNTTTTTGVAINSGTGGVALVSTSTGTITAASGSTILLDSVGVLELNSSAGVISIGNDAVSQNINVGTAGTRAIAIGNSTSTTSVSINGGTGSSVNIGTNAIAHTVTIGNITTTTAVTVNTGTGGFNVNTTSTGDIVLNSADTVLIDGAGVVEINSSAGVIGIGNDAVAQNINVGTGAAARTITIGNTSSTTGIVLNSGTGGVAINTTTTGDVVVTSADTVLIDGAGVVEINSSGAAIGIGNDNVAQAINIGTGSAARTISIGTGVGGNTVHIADGAGINTITIGNGAAANTVTLGSTDTTSTTTINSGSGNVNIIGGHLSIGSVAKTLLVNGGAVTDFIGTGVLTAGTQTIANTNIATGDVILLTRTGVAASTTLGVLTYTIINATSFTVTSVILGTPGSTQTADVSTYAYFIVRPF